MSPREFHPPEPTDVPQGVPIAPPPWPLKVKLWTFLYSSPSPSNATANTTVNPNNAPEILQGAPPGSYNPLEVINPRALEPLSDGSDAGRFQLQEGGMDLRGVVLVRYEDTPAGSYDELLLIPGTYTAPGKKSRDKKAQRVTNIYVSTDASVWNGRWNWNIAKHRADFSFEPIDARRTRVRVSHPTDSPLYAGGAPFFSAILTSSRIPSIPLPSQSPFSIIQPPLERPHQGALEAVIATSTAGHPWLKISPTYKGKWGISWIGREEGREVYGDGVSFPTLEGMWALGSVFEGEIAFPFATVVDVS